MTTTAAALTEAEMRTALNDENDLTYLTEDECRWALALLIGRAPEAASEAIAMQISSRPDGYAAQHLADRQKVAAERRKAHESIRAAATAAKGAEQ